MHDRRTLHLFKLRLVTDQKEEQISDVFGDDEDLDPKVSLSQKIANLIETDDIKSAVSVIKKNLSSDDPLGNSKYIFTILNNSLFYVEEPDQAQKWINFFEELLSDPDITKKNHLWCILLEVIETSSESTLREGIITLFLNYYEDKERYLIAVLTTQQVPVDIIVNALAKVEGINKQQFVHDLTQAIILKYDYVNLQKIVSEYKLDLQKIGLDKSLLETGEKLILLKDKSKQVFFKANIDPFVHGFGKIYYKDGLLTCAQIASRKKYPFNPTVLKGPGEFEKYVTILIKATSPIRERFVVSGEHWISGDIQIDEKGIAKIILIDSLGHSSKWIEHIVFIFGRQFPEHPVFIARNVRQHSELGCSVFALDDVRHLFTVEKYLSPEFKGLFDYLEKQNKEMYEFKSEKSGETFSVAIVDLPLSLMMTTQSKKLVDSIIPDRPDREKRTPINKKKQMASEAASIHIETVIWKDQKDKEQNLRLQYVLKKTARHNCNYLLTRSEKDIKQESESFSLGNLSKRMVK